MTVTPHSRPPIIGLLAATLLAITTTGCQITGASASINSDNPLPAFGLSLSPKPLPKLGKRKNPKQDPNKTTTSSSQDSPENQPRRIQLPRTDPLGKSQTPEDEAAD